MHVGGARKGPLNILRTRGRTQPKKPLKLVICSEGAREFLCARGGTLNKNTFKISYMIRSGREFFYAQRGTLNKKTIKISYTLKSGRLLKTYCFTLAAPRPPGGPLAPTLDQHAPVRGPPQLWAAPYAPGERGASVVRGPLYPLCNVNCYFRKPKMPSSNVFFCPNQQSTSQRYSVYYHRRLKKPENIHI